MLSLARWHVLGENYKIHVYCYSYNDIVRNHPRIRRDRKIEQSPYSDKEGSKRGQRRRGYLYTTELGRIPSQSLTTSKQAEEWTYDSDNQEPHGASKPKGRQTSDTPQYNRHVNSRLSLRLLTRLEVKALYACCAQHDGAQRKIAEHPKQHDGASESLVVILLLLACARLLLLLNGFFGETLHFNFVL